MSNHLYYFISDLHLSESTTILNNAFDDFLRYCAKNLPKKLYILGDLFDYYLGFDVTDEWGGELASKINKLTQLGIEVYFLPGNRDFLVEKSFLNASKMTLLKDPCQIVLNNKKVMLSHGDFLCINDIKHQKFRKLSQSKLVKFIFLRLPKKYRIKLAKKIRQAGRERTLTDFHIEPSDKMIVTFLKKLNSNILIHGHTHRPMNRFSNAYHYFFQHIVLPDWKNQAEFLIYDPITDNFIFTQLPSH